MPRGHKSKLRSREKRRQARSETQNLTDAQATEAKEEGSPSFSSPVLGATSRISPPAGSSTSGQRPGRAFLAALTPAGVSGEGSDEYATMQDEDSPCTTQGLFTTDFSCRSPVDQKAILLVQFLLRKYNMKENITKADMLKYIIKKHKHHFDEIFKKASELMVLAFGIEVKEVDPARQCYALSSRMQHRREEMMSGESMPKTGLLMTVLCVIFMKGNRATEEDIWEVLNVMGIYAGRKHFIYGEPRKLITQDLVQEKYLEYRQVPHSDPPRYEFLWGPRAHAETSKMKVLEFLARVHDTTPTAFPSWYEEALREEEERARSRLAALARTNAIASADIRISSSYFQPE